MSLHQRTVPGNSNAGPGEHSNGRSHNPTVGYEVSGPVRWLDAPGARLVVHVREANGHSGRYLDQDVTFDLAGVDVPADLLPGVVVRVRARMARDLGPAGPDPVPAAAVEVVG
jgi:hypothetical protein